MGNRLVTTKWLLAGYAGAVDRPLAGEPLAVDLLNTRWRSGDREVDLLAGSAGLRQWLDETKQESMPADEAVGEALRATRRALLDVVDGRSGGQQALNAVLARGLTVGYLDGTVARRRVLLTDDAWGPAWRAASSYLELIDAAPDGIRHCAGAGCILHFYDPTGRRRWCSMTGCGNRAKGERFRSRRRTGSP